MYKSYIQVLGAGTPDGGCSLLLFFDDRRYLFSCAPGTQRFCTQHHIRLSKLNAIFLPRLEWSHAGGLPGKIFTLADAGFSGVTIVGPVGTNHFIGSLRAFLRRSSFTLRVMEYDSEQDVLYRDDLITVKAIEVFSGKDNFDSLEATPLSDVENLHVETMGSHGFVLKMFSDLHTRNEEEPCHIRSNDEKMPRFSYRDSSLCYSVEGPTVPGKFDPTKAKYLGIPPGPLYSKLVRGESVELPDGRIVLPSDCVLPNVPGPIMLLIDIKSSEQLEDLKRKRDKLICDRVNLVFYWCNHAIYNDLLFIRDAIPKAKHVWIDPDNHEIVFNSSLEIVEKLHDIDKKIFFFNISEYHRNDGAKALTKYYWHSSLSLSDPMIEYHKTVSTFHGIIDDKKSSAPPPLPLLPVTKHLKLISRHLPVASPSDPIVTFLGTGAALPGKYRNVSSTLVDFGDSALLLDCGEATYGQLIRKFGSDHTKSILDKLKLILISHLHADHQLGVPELLNRKTGRPVTIVAPSRYKTFLEELSECSRLYHSSFEFIPIEDNPRILDICSSFSVESVPVIHCPYSYGFVIIHQGSAFKLTYSGDTRPCKLLFERGIYSNILVHEATFDDDLQSEAIEKRHSTISEAISVGREMQAQFILLTHISQRHAKSLPSYNWEDSNPGNVIPAIDLMSLQYSVLQKINLKQLISQMTSLLSAIQVDQYFTE